MKLHTTMGMEWRTIPEFPDYEMSNYGLVRSHKTKTPIAPSIVQKCYFRYNLFDKKGVRQRVYEQKLWTDTWESD